MDLIQTNIGTFVCACLVAIEFFANFTPTDLNVPVAQKHERTNTTTQNWNELPIHKQ